MKTAAYAVSTTKLTMEVEVVTLGGCWIALRDDSQTTHAIILILVTDSVSLLQKVEWEAHTGIQVYMYQCFDIHLQILMWKCCHGHARIEGK